MVLYGVHIVLDPVVRVVLVCFINVLYTCFIFGVVLFQRSKIS